MAIKTKYSWQIGSPLPTLDRHSEVKHKIVQDYIRRYIQTVMLPAHIPKLQLSLIDGFSGGGCYASEDGTRIVNGSPLLMMEAVKEARTLLNLDRRVPREINVDYTFIDIMPDTTKYLDYWLKAKLDERLIEASDFARVRICNGDFLDELPKIIQSIKQKRMGQRSIFVLDQYNYDDLPLSKISEILTSLDGSEVILTFNVGSLITFISDRAQNRRPLERLGIDQYVPWDKIRQLKAENKQSWRQILQRHIAHGIRTESGAKFMTLFFVKPWGANPWDYWLIHLSNRYRAHEVMKTLHWEHATEFGHELEPGVFVMGYNTNKDESYTGQSTFTFDDNSKIACIEGIREHFGQAIYSLDGPIRLGDLFQNCVSNSTAAEAHLMEATRQLHSTKDIVIVSKDGARRRNNMRYSLDDVIESARQHKFFGV